MSPAELAGFEVPDFFADAPVIDHLELNFMRFESALGRAALDALDTEALTLVTASIEYARDNGALSRVMQMAMIVGAAACQHDHLQEYSNAIADTFVLKNDHDDGHHHAANGEHGDEEHKKKDKKKKKTESSVRANSRRKPAPKLILRLAA